MILPDTSAWIEAFRETRSSLCQSLVGLLRSDAEIVVAEAVVMEILAGVRSLRDLRAKRRRMLAFPMIRVGSLETYERASAVQRACRAGGEPARSMMDCLIAAVTIREGASLLHGDRDFDVIARHTDLRIHPVDAA